MVVVDPGVGTPRRILAVESAGRIFLAPDNGVLTFVIGIAHSVENASLFLPDGSTTFHGRDRFAPVAASLANGMAIDQLDRAWRTSCGSTIGAGVRSPPSRRDDRGGRSLRKSDNRHRAGADPVRGLCAETHSSSAASRHFRFAGRRISR